MPQPLPGLLGFDIPAHCYTSQEMPKYNASCPARVCCVVPHQEQNSKSTFKTTLPTGTKRFLFHRERAKNPVAFDTHLATGADETGLWYVLPLNWQDQL